MKSIFFSTILLLPYLCFSQNTELNLDGKPITGKGYVNSISLDSVPSNYAQVEMDDPSSHSFILRFRYTRDQYKVQEEWVRDVRDKPIVFSSLAEALNYLEQNGWAYREQLPAKGTALILLKKKDSNRSTPQDR